MGTRGGRASWGFAIPVFLLGLWTVAVSVVVWRGTWTARKQIRQSRYPDDRRRDAGRRHGRTAGRADATG